MRRFAGSVALLILVLVAGCSMLSTHKDDFTKINDDFMLRMTWHDMPGASQHFSPELREEFLKRFEAWDDLKITSFKAVRSEGLLEPGLERKRVHYLLEYHALPSLSIKKKRFSLRWEMPDKTGAWAIVEAFPELD